MTGYAITNAYRASDELAAAWRTYGLDLAQFWSDVETWNTAHPDAPALFVGRKPWRHGVVVRGFVLSDGASVPRGLRRPNPKAPLLTPYEAKGRGGEAWAELLATAPKPPDIAQKLHEFGLREQFLAGPGWSEILVLPALRVLGDIVYVTTAVKHPATPHLTEVKLSEYHLAVENEETET